MVSWKEMGIRNPLADSWKFEWFWILSNLNFSSLDVGLNKLLSQVTKHLLISDTPKRKILHTTAVLR